MNAVLRIIDANLNRAREAMRVMEEYARFALDDESLAAACKNARHDLAGAVRSLAQRLQTRDDRIPRMAETAALLVAHRDILGDVGQAITTVAETQRESAEEVVVAAGKRLSEALRAIEEYGKVFDADFAAAIERLRYRGYEIERRLALTLRARERFLDVRLYVIITEAICKRDWFATAEAALDGGADCLQLREKNLTDRELLDRTSRLADLCHERGKMLIVNNRPDIAAAAKAHGVHVGQDDLPLSAVRRLLPPGGFVGVSTHTTEQIERVALEVPDYIAVGPMFATATKPQSHAATPKLLAAARRLTSLPLVAIGGITAENADAVLAARPDCLCVCAAVIGADDPAAAARSLRQRFDVAPSDASHVSRPSRASHP